MANEQTLTMNQLFSFLSEIGLSHIASSIGERTHSEEGYHSHRETVQIDEHFLDTNGDRILDAIIERITTTANGRPNDAYGMLVSSMNMVSRMSNTAAPTGLGRWGNWALKNISKWKSAADAIKTHLNATGYSIGANLSVPPGIYIELHF